MTRTITTFLEISQRTQGHYFKTKTQLEVIDGDDVGDEEESQNNTFIRNEANIFLLMHDESDIFYDLST
jgi:hypothetical protein